ncbi:porin [Alphaproteobacteria bacterium]|nr:porin [Alphaproteobacteria bacterium]
MKKTIILGIIALAFAFTSTIKAEMSLSGYQEFFAGSADQSTYQGRDNDHDQDQAGIKNGQYTRITANYSSTLDSGIDVSGVLTVMSRDCQGTDTGNCGVVNHNFVNLSGNFGTVSVGERFDAGAAMLSRMTASGPMSEPDGNQINAVYGTSDAANVYGNGNEQNYANNNLKAVYMSNVYSGFSFAVGYTPNMAEGGQNTTGQATSVTNGKWTNFNDVLSVFGKYAMEMDGVGLELVYGQQTGNAGRVGVSDYNDLEENAYSIKISYAGFSADYRKNEADNSGLIKNGQDGNDEGTSVCAQYDMGNLSIGSCSVETSYTDTSNLSNSSDLMTYSAEYQLGGGVKVGATYFDFEQTANGQKRTDMDGIAARLAVGF